MLKRTQAMIAIAGAVCLALVGVAGPAAAATSDCRSGTNTNVLCLWEDHDYVTNGNGLGLNPTVNYDSHLGNDCYNGTSCDVVGDSSSSGFNRSNSSFTLYFDASCDTTSPHFTVASAWADANFGNDSPLPFGAASDQISSLARSGYVGTCQAG